MWFVTNRFSVLSKITVNLSYVVCLLEIKKINSGKLKTLNKQLTDQAWANGWTKSGDLKVSFSFTLTLLYSFYFSAHLIHILTFSVSAVFIKDKLYRCVKVFKTTLRWWQNSTFRDMCL